MKSPDYKYDRDKTSTDDPQDTFTSKELFKHHDYVTAAYTAYYSGDWNNQSVIHHLGCR
jgi:hypothetical protein